MAEKKSVTIVIRKDVATEAAAKTLIDIVKLKLADKPGVTVAGTYTSHQDPYTIPA